MSSKSANYCSSYDSDGYALLLLCEAELGKPMQTLTGASYEAAETAKEMGAYSTWGQGQTAPKAWKDAGCIHPSLAGATMVCDIPQNHHHLLTPDSPTPPNFLAQPTYPVPTFSTMSTSVTMSLRSAFATSCVSKCEVLEWPKGIQEADGRDVHTCFHELFAKRGVGSFKTGVETIHPLSYHITSSEQLIYIFI